MLGSKLKKTCNRLGGGLKRRPLSNFPRLCFKNMRPDSSIVRWVRLSWLGSRSSLPRAMLQASSSPSRSSDDRPGCRRDQRGLTFKSRDPQDECRGSGSGPPWVGMCGCGPEWVEVGMTRDSTSRRPMPCPLRPAPDPFGTFEPDPRAPSWNQVEINRSEHQRRLGPGKLGCSVYRGIDQLHPC